MDQTFNLEQYLTNSVENIVKSAVKASLSNPKESVFMAKYALASRKASKRRHEAEKRELHVPAFLIASITSKCNLHCAGCYSRAIDSCNDKAPTEQLDDETWKKIFQESADLGISFIMLAGGEPLLRRDILTAAASIPEILFPVITNGTLLKGDYLNLFDQNRNLFPVISIEGDREITDQRRGDGIYKALDQIMEDLTKRDIFFGVSITVTTKNLREVVSREFIEDLHQKGCKLVFYVEYVPVDEQSGYLAPGDQERIYMEEHLLDLRKVYEDMLFVSFPGDERVAGGCLAAGRGFFHINSHGGAEPCPFSPVSDCCVQDIGVEEALKSPLFTSLKSSELLAKEHTGSCALFGKDEEVKALMESAQ